MSTWEYNEVRQAIEDRIGMVLAPNDAHRAAELAMQAFYSFEAGYDLIETTQLGSADETAIQRCLIAARVYYGDAENLWRRPEWSPVSAGGK